jgi:hypothetical protein
MGLYEQVAFWITFWILVSCILQCKGAQCDFGDQYTFIIYGIFNLKTLMKVFFLSRSRFHAVTTY